MSSCGPSAADSGLYALLIELPADEIVRVGSLGQLSLPAGHYVYVGSGKRHLTSRLDRHHRRRKRLRWHIDYLLRRGRIEDVAVRTWRPVGECALVQRALGSGRAERAVAGFGSSDCRCPGHLLRLRADPAPDWAVALFGRGDAQPGPTDRERQLRRPGSAAARGRVAGERGPHRALARRGVRT